MIFNMIYNTLIVWLLAVGVSVVVGGVSEDDFEIGKEEWWTFVAGWLPTWIGVVGASNVGLFFSVIKHILDEKARVLNEQRTFVLAAITHKMILIDAATPRYHEITKSMNIERLE